MRLNSASAGCAWSTRTLTDISFAAAAVAGAADRRRAEIVEPDRDPHMGIGGADAVGGIEGDPAELGHEGLGPGVAGLLLDHAVVAMEIAADVARRDRRGCAPPR